MTVLKRRNRQLSFRLSDDEYARLCDLCVLVGARSVSDIARTAVCQMLDSGELQADSRLEQKMRSLDLQVRQLNHRLEILSGVVQRSTGYGAQNTSAADGNPK